MTPHLEPLREQDLEFVRSLRNSLRHWFFDSTPLVKAAQRRWYRQVYLKSQCLFWIIWYDGKPVGTISWTMRVGYGEIGNLMLLPDYQGKGIMQQVMQQIMQPGCFYVAHVKSDNSSSLNLFKRAGFWRVPKRSKRAR